jgi:signal transduction histidine kinase
VDPTRKLIERRETSLLSLFELSRELGVGLDPYAMAQLTLFSLMGHFGAGSAALWLLPEGGEGAPVLLRAFGVKDEPARRMGQTLAARLGDSIGEAPDVVRMSEWAERGFPEGGAALELGLALVAPILIQGRLIGITGLGPRLDGESYGALDLEYLATAAGMVAVAIENARLYRRARESNRQLRETNDRLAELDRLKSEFLNNVNHELRTPLAVIIGYLDVLRSTTEGQAQDSVSIASRQASKLDALIVNLLDFSKLEDRVLRLSLEPHDLGDLLREFTDTRRPGVADGLRELELELEAALPPVSCDRRRLLQILDELLDNAVKFTQPGSRIRLGARLTGDRTGVEVAIQDDGAGIPGDRLETLFEPFRQGDGSTTREAGGLGLGLALARKLAEAMGGALEAESEPGVGSRFVVKLHAA